MAEKVVSQKAELQAEISVVRKVRAVINPNGRGYDEDNVVRYLDHEVTKFTVKAGTAAELRTKVDIILSTIDEEHIQ